MSINGAFHFFHHIIEEMMLPMVHSPYPPGDTQLLEEFWFEMMSFRLYLDYWDEFFTSTSATVKPTCSVSLGVANRYHTIVKIRLSVHFHRRICRTLCIKVEKITITRIRTIWWIFYLWRFDIIKRPCPDFVGIPVLESNDNYLKWIII